MHISYNKLWKLLIDRNIKKKELQQKAGISASLITKLGRQEPVTMTVLMKICEVLRCDIGDIVEFIYDNDVAPNDESMLIEGDE